MLCHLFDLAISVCFRKGAPAPAAGFLVQTIERSWSCSILQLADRFAATSIVSGACCGFALDQIYGMRNMRTTERDTLLFFLAITSGSADSWSYLGLDHAFVANMTGNTVLLGIAIFGEHSDMLHPLVSMVCYAAGVAIGTFFTRKVRPGSVWAKSISGVLFIEAFLLVVGEVTWICVKGMPGPMLRCLVLGGVATAIGLQSGAMLPLKLPGIVTTYITGTLSTLVSGVVLLSSRRERVSGSQASFEDRLLIQGVFLVTYFVSAIAAGWAFRYMPVVIGGITSVPILIVAAYGAIRGE
jgi:uncharacterized membrane protein YoaK (UPF0700 family)